MTTLALLTALKAIVWCKLTFDVGSKVYHVGSRMRDHVAGEGAGGDGLSCQERQVTHVVEIICSKTYVVKTITR